MARERLSDEEQRDYPAGQEAYGVDEPVISGKAIRPVIPRNDAAPR